MRDSVGVAQALKNFQHRYKVDLNPKSAKVDVVTFMVLAHWLPGSFLPPTASATVFKTTPADEYQSHSENPSSQPHHQDPNLAGLVMKLSTGLDVSRYPGTRRYIR